MGFRSKRTFRLCWGQLERLNPRKKISQDWLQLDEGDPGFQLLTQEEFAAVLIFIYLFSSALPVLLNFPFICFLSFLYLSVLAFASWIRINGGFTVCWLGLSWLPLHSMRPDVRESSSLIVAQLHNLSSNNILSHPYQSALSVLFMRCLVRISGAGIAQSV
jgi:hypothetical protein